MSGITRLIYLHSLGGFLFFSPSSFLICSKICNDRDSTSYSREWKKRQMTNKQSNSCGYKRLKEKGTMEPLLQTIGFFGFICVLTTESDVAFYQRFSGFFRIAFRNLFKKIRNFATLEYFSFASDSI
jgi:hypothetical protein